MLSVCDISPLKTEVCSLSQRASSSFSKSGDAVVIGGGPAGLMAAIALKRRESSEKVTVYEMRKVQSRDQNLRTKFGQSFHTFLETQLPKCLAHRWYDPKTGGIRKIWPIAGVQAVLTAAAALLGTEFRIGTLVDATFGDQGWDLTFKDDSQKVRTNRLIEAHGSVHGAIKKMLPGRVASWTTPWEEPGEQVVNKRTYSVLAHVDARQVSAATSAMTFDLSSRHHTRVKI